MIPALLGRKIGMTQVFDDHGAAIPVTVIEAGPCAVMQVRDDATDGYEALQLGFSDVKPHRSTKPLPTRPRSSKRRPSPLGEPPRNATGSAGISPSAPTTNATTSPNLPSARDDGLGRHVDWLRAAESLGRTVVVAIRNSSASDR